MFRSLACDVGGTFGLFLGCSILTLIELFYLFIYECFGWRRDVRNFNKGLERQRTEFKKTPGTIYELQEGTPPATRYRKPLPPVFSAGP